MFTNRTLRTAHRKILVRQAIKRHLIGSVILKGATGIFLEGHILDNVVVPTSGGYFNTRRETSSLIFKSLHQLRTEPFTSSKQRVLDPKGNAEALIKTWIAFGWSPVGTPKQITKDLLHHAKIAPRETKRSKVTNFVLAFV